MKIILWVILEECMHVCHSLSVLSVCALTDGTTELVSIGLQDSAGAHRVLLSPVGSRHPYSSCYTAQGH